MLQRFYGGVRVAGRKSATRAIATQPMEHPPARVLLPVAEPLVTVGDHVEVGTRLCHGGERGAVHASVSGTVAELGRYRLTEAARRSVSWLKTTDRTPRPRWGSVLLPSKRPLTWRRTIL